MKKNHYSFPCLPERAERAVGINQLKRQNSTKSSTRMSLICKLAHLKKDISAYSPIYVPS